MYARLGLFALVLVACGNGPRTSDAGHTGDPAHGALVAQMQTCNSSSCHGTDLGGSTSPLTPGSTVYAANITPDTMHGIGGWTDAQIEAAVRTGVAPTRTLCPDMLRFPSMTAQDMADLLAYLHTVTPVSRAVPASTCM